MLFTFHATGLGEYLITSDQSVNGLRLHFILYFQSSIVREWRWGLGLGRGLAPSPVNKQQTINITHF